MWDLQPAPATLRWRAAVELLCPAGEAAVGAGPAARQCPGDAVPGSGPGLLLLSAHAAGPSEQSSGLNVQLSVTIHHVF